MSELKKMIQSLQIMDKYDTRDKSYFEMSGEGVLIPVDIDPNEMSVVDRKAILDLRMFHIVSYGKRGEKMWNTEQEREDGDIWTYDENLNILTEGDE